MQFIMISIFLIENFLHVSNLDIGLFSKSSLVVMTRALATFLVLFRFSEVLPIISVWQ